MLVRRSRWLDRASGLRRRRPGGCDMGSLGPTHLISLLLAVAIIAAICGFIASAVARRNKRRARGLFLLGFFCGWMAGAILRGRHQGLNALGAVARCPDIRPRRAGRRRGTGHLAVHALTLAASHGLRGLWPPRWHRQMSQRLPLGWVSTTRRHASLRRAPQVSRRAGTLDGKRCRSSANADERLPLPNAGMRTLRSCIIKL